MFNKNIYSLNHSCICIGFPGPPFFLTIGRYYSLKDEGIASGPQPRLIVARILRLYHLLRLSHLLACYRIWLSRTVNPPWRILWHLCNSSCSAVIPRIRSYKYPLRYWGDISHAPFFGFYFFIVYFFVFIYLFIYLFFGFYDFFCYNNSSSSKISGSYEPCNMLHYFLILHFST